MVGRTHLLALVLLLVLLPLAGCGAGQAPPPRDGVLIHVQRGVHHPHPVLMALQMAEIMAADRDVLVYFDVDGIDVVLNDAQDLSYDGFPSSREQIYTLLAEDVTLMACPSCLEAAGKSGDELIEGVIVAEKDRFFDFTEGRILTLDY